MPDQTGSVTAQYVVDTFNSGFGFNFGQHYYYGVQAVPDDPNNLIQGYRYTPGLAVSILVVPEGLPLLDNQTVDARYDLRYSTYTFQNHNFGSSSYRGGLYVGNATDPSRMGRSFLRFGVPNAPMDSFNHWYLPAQLTCWTSSLGAYFTGASQTNLTGWTVGAQFVADNSWTSALLNWSNAPTLDPTMPTASVQIVYDKTNPVFGWYTWPMGNIGLSYTLATSGSLCAGLAVTTESSDQQNQLYSWLYFAKREWNAANAPYLLFAWSSGPNVTLTLTPLNGTVQGGVSLSGTLACMNLHADLTVTLYSEDPLHVIVPQTVTIPASSGSVTFPILTHTVTGMTSVRVIFGYNNWTTVTLTP